jgi:hypothetical protein
MPQSYDDAAEGERPEPPDSDTPDESPPTEPSGALVPPPSTPPTALSASADLPPPKKPRNFVEAWRRSGWSGQSTLERFATQLFDALDGFADRVASELGIR